MIPLIKKFFQSEKKALKSKQDQIKELSQLYKSELLTNVIPFWEKHSKDEQCGGFFTCLDQFGKVYDKDKFVWLQGRETWCFSVLYDKVEPRPLWLEMAKYGADFLEKHCHDKEGNYYFSLNQEGQPLIQPYNIFSDCFACMGFAALDKISPNEQYKQNVKNIFANILKRKDNWKGQYSKSYPGTRNMKNFSLPMILCNLAIECEHILGKDQIDQLAKDLIKQFQEHFYQKDYNIVVENVSPEGKFIDCYEGRVVNPGHVIEACWFFMDLAKRLNDEAFLVWCKNLMLRVIDFGWDKEFGGIFYFKDVKGYPPQQLEWDQKLWWVHIETLVGLAKAYLYTKDEKCWEMFLKVHEYTWSHFRDHQYMEWFGYLNRRGEVLLNLKGGKWKGFFHVPRGLLITYKTLEQMIEKK